MLEKGGTMRLGAYLCKLHPESRIRKIYGTDSVMERHRHRYEFTNRYRELFEKNGMVFGGIHPTANLVETIEIHGPSLVYRHPVPSGIQVEAREAASPVQGFHTGGHREPKRIAAL